MKNHKIYMRSLLQTSLGRSFYEAGQKLSEFIFHLLIGPSNLLVKVLQMSLGRL